MNQPEALLSFRRELYEHFGPAQTALSADGHEVRFATPVNAGLMVGGFAVVVADGSPDLVVQVRSLAIVERDGPELSIAVDLAVPGATVEAATIRPPLRMLAGTAVVLGTIEGTTFTSVGQVSPFGERLIRSATSAEVAAIAEGLAAGGGSIEIGVLRQATDVPFRLAAKGFARHTFMCGQSGSGKTYTTGALFERLLAATTLRLMVLDPNSDHVHLGSLRDDDDHSPEAERYRAVAATVRVARARGLGAPITLCADFSDLGLDIQALLLRLHPVADADEYDALRRVIDQLEAPYSARDVMETARSMGDAEPLAGRLARRIGNLGVAEWDVWRRDGETSIAQLGLRHERCVVFDLGSLPRPDERTALSLALLGVRWAQRHEREPVLIAIDEAHNVLPAMTTDPLLQATTDLGVLIAGEGRKFGLHLFVATQRPSKVHPNVVSQCDNLLLMRMNGARDVDDLEALFSHVPPAMVRESLGFGLGEALFAGPISPVPMVAKVGARLSREGGGDVPTTWAMPPA